MNNLVTKPYKFELDSENKYIVITDAKLKTLQNDGGSHVNIYYQIDLDNNLISKVQEIYKANLGGEPIVKIDIQYIKKIDSSTKEETKTLLEDILTKEIIEEVYTAYAYEIKTINNKKEIFDQKIIDTINDFINKLDELPKRER